MSTGRVVDSGRFDPAEFAAELRLAPRNHELGTALLFANDRVRVFEVRLESGPAPDLEDRRAVAFW